MKDDVARKYRVKSKDHPFGLQEGHLVHSENRDGKEWITLDFNKTDEERLFLVSYVADWLERTN